MWDGVARPSPVVLALSDVRQHDSILYQGREALRVQKPPSPLLICTYGLINLIIIIIYGYAHCFTRRGIASMERNGQADGGTRLRG